MCDDGELTCNGDVKVDGRNSESKRNKGAAIVDAEFMEVLVAVKP